MKLLRELKFKLYNIKRGIKNLIIWFKVIWNDRDWDYIFIYDILEFKLNKQAEYFKKQGHLENSDKNGNKIFECVDIIRKLKSNYYESEAMSYCDMDMRFDEESGINFEITRDNLDEYFKKYPKVYKKVVKEYPNISRATLFGIMGMELSNIERKRLFNLISDNIESWWD